jgi:hypothetical protein
MLTCSFCRFTQAALSWPAERNGAAFLSAAQHKEACHRLGGPGCHGLILIDALSSSCWEEKKEREREIVRGLFSQGWTCLAGCACAEFSWLLGAIKG